MTTRRDFLKKLMTGAAAVSLGSVLPGEPSETVAQAQPVPKAMQGVFVVLIVMTVASSFIAAAWLG